MSDRIRELLLELCEELLPQEDIVALAGRGGSKKGRVTRVATQAGVQTYGVPIGTVITEQMKEAAKAGGVTPAVAPVGGLPKPAVPGMPSVPKLPTPGATTPQAPAKPKGGGQDAASQFNADPNLKMENVHTHPGAPGARVYQFSDGTAVFEDAKGTRSKRQKLDTKVLQSKGWNSQGVNNDQAGAQGSAGGNGGHARLSTDKPNSYENATRTLEALDINKSSYTSVHRKAVKKYESEGVQINDILRKGEDVGQHFETVSDLRDLLDHSKTSKPVTVHRGMSFESPEERDSFVNSALKPGTSFVDKGFTVASANSDNAKLHADNDNPDNPGLMVNIAVSKGSRAASLNSVSGKNDQDQDVLLADGSKFKVDSVSRDASGRPIVELTYLDPAKPAHERLADEENIAITDEQKEAARARRFSWSPNDIQLDHIPINSEADVPGPPKPVKATTAKAIESTTVSKKPSISPKAGGEKSPKEVGSAKSVTTSSPSDAKGRVSGSPKPKSAKDAASVKDDSVKVVPPKDVSKWAFDQDKDLNEGVAQTFAYGDFNDSVSRPLVAIAKHQGFDAKPTKGSVDDTVAKGGIEIHRGIISHERTGTSAQAIEDQMLNGEYEPGKGNFGNGYYFSTSPGIGKMYAGAPIAEKGYNTKSVTGGRVVRAALQPDAKIVDYEDIKELHKEWQIKHRDKVQYDTYATGFIVGKDKISPTIMDGLNDPGHFAALMGYDAIRVPLKDRPQDRRNRARIRKKIGNDDLGDEIVVLNRGALVVDE